MTTKEVCTRLTVAWADPTSLPDIERERRKGNKPGKISGKVGYILTSKFGFRNTERTDRKCSKLH